MWLLSVLFATVLYGASIQGRLKEHDVIIANNTGIYIARLEIDGVRKAEEIEPRDKILVEISPHKHHMRVIFRGGASVEWPNFDFRGVHQLSFQRYLSRFEAHTQ